MQVQSGQRIHRTCRRDFCDTKVLLRRSKSLPDIWYVDQPVLRSKKHQFSFEENCIFCGMSANFYAKHNSNEVSLVKLKDFKDKIKEICSKRNDTWAVNVLGRVEFSIDLIASNARYHSQCSVNFRTKKDLPQGIIKQKSSLNCIIGRPYDVIRRRAFLKVAQYFEENDDGKTTIKFLVDKMNQYIADDADSDSGCRAFEPIHMKRSLIKIYGEKILITEIN